MASWWPAVLLGCAVAGGLTLRRWREARRLAYHQALLAEQTAMDLDAAGLHCEALRWYQIAVAYLDDALAAGDLDDARLLVAARIAVEAGASATARTYLGRVRVEQLAAPEDQLRYRWLCELLGQPEVSHG